MVTAKMMIALTALATAMTASAQSCAGQWGQCGGNGYSGPTCCPSGWSCVKSNPYYSQCLQGAAAPSTTSKAAVVTTSTSAAAVTSAKTTSTSLAQPKPTTTSSSAPAPVATGGASTTGFLGGLNLAGFEFGISVWGWAGTYVAPPVSQIAHFASQGVNVFRIPTAWQYLQSSPGGELNAGFFSQYDAFVQAALQASTSPYVILDLHNYGRWNSGVVGKDGPTGAQFASLWGALAKKYAGNSKIIFGLMNEPHDMDIGAFKEPLQLAVNAIRAAGATSQIILLPGTDWTHASSFLSTNKAVLSTITDPAGGKSKLVYDFHQYLDQDGSGTNRECVTDRSDLWGPIADDLKRDGRKAFVSEIGGASTESCQRYLKSALSQIKARPEAYLGYAVWSAGAFDQGYELSLTPAGNVDTPIWNAAVKPNLPSSNKKRSHNKARMDAH